MSRELAKDFVVAGTASESLYGACESMFKPDMVCYYSILQIYLTTCFLNFRTGLVLFYISGFIVSGPSRSNSRMNEFFSLSY